MEDRKPLYRYSRQEAESREHLDIWRESYRENCACARAIEQAIADNYRDNTLNDITGEIISRYGFDRMNWVLANTVRQKVYDGRFSDENKAWAASFFIPGDENNHRFAVNSHPGLVNLAIDQARSAWKKLGLFDGFHCTDETDYTGKLLIMRADSLKEEYRTPDFQLFFAKGGFGCREDTLGRKVFGAFLKDGEETSFTRCDFIGVIKDEFIPDWAKEKLDEMQNPNGDETESASVEDISIGGIE
ncbi:MAG: DUF3849 domain-containing protein [Clostridia bacterium]|nr:DUF3849 domain-containing protein [Clostridia bacterium]